MPMPMEECIGRKLSASSPLTMTIVVKNLYKNGALLRRRSILLRAGPKLLNLLQIPGFFTLQRFCHAALGRHLKPLVPHRELIRDRLAGGEFFQAIARVCNPEGDQRMPSRRQVHCD